ncbi:MAG: hypothetical protein AB8B87_04200 [Granulosicoccus sp.]
MTSSPSTTKHLPLLGIALFLIALINLVFSITSGLITAQTDSLFIHHLNLGVENTVGVWWSSTCLWLGAIMFFESGCRRQDNRAPLLIIASLLAVLSLDELGSLHERLFESNLWLFFLIGITGALLFLYSFVRLFNEPSTRKSSIIVFIGFSFFATVVLQEYFEHNVDWPLWLQGIRTSVEEGTELLGSLLVLLSGARLLGLDAPGLKCWPDRTADARPYVTIVTIAAVVLGSLAAWVSPSLSGYPKQGNPALWFATVAYLVLTLELFRGRTLNQIHWSRAMVGLISLGLSVINAIFVYTFNDSNKLIVLTLSAYVLLLVLLSRTSVLHKPYLFASLVIVSLFALLAYQGSAASLFALTISIPLSLIVMHNNDHRTETDRHNTSPRETGESNPAIPS